MQFVNVLEQRFGQFWPSYLGIFLILLGIIILIVFILQKTPADIKGNFNLLMMLGIGILSLTLFLMVSLNLWSQYNKLKNQSNALFDGDQEITLKRPSKKAKMFKIIYIIVSILLALLLVGGNIWFYKYFIVGKRLPR